MSGVIMLVGTIICLTVPGQLIGMFTTNPQTIAAGKTALRIICAGFLISSVSVTACGALEGAWQRNCLIDRLSLQIPDHYPSGSIYPESFLRSRWCMERFLDCGSADRRGILAYQQEGYRGIIP